LDRNEYERLSELYRSTRRLPPAERGKILSELEDEERELHERLVVLLGSEGREDPLSEARLETNRRRLDDWIEQAGSSGGDDWTPDSIGGHRVIRLVGQGGMGVVFEGWQGSPSRRIALKVVHPMQSSPERLRRIRREGQVLARLQHPGIAQVFEAGTEDFGRGPQPWFSMEFVEGIDLCAYAVQGELGVRERVALIVEIADAVQHAHGRGVLHCDLKPENVLVDTAGRPRVLDFGVARVTEECDELSTMVSLQGQLAGTLAYMAPEQLDAGREPVTERSDVYALGVLAYELLAGRRPIEVGGLSISAAIPHLLRYEPPGLGRLNPSLAGDLETIVRKSLEKDPGRRYGSAADFADDLRNYLGARPIVARPPSFGYRARKFTQRNRGLVGGVVATFLTVVIGLIVAIVLARSEGEQRKLADDRADLARESELRAVAGALKGAQLLAAEGRALESSFLLSELWKAKRPWAWRHVESRLPWFLPPPESPVQNYAMSSVFSPDGETLYFPRGTHLWSLGVFEPDELRSPFGDLELAPQQQIVGEGALYANSWTDVSRPRPGDLDLFALDRSTGQVLERVLPEAGFMWRALTPPGEVPTLMYTALEARVLGEEGVRFRFEPSEPFKSWEEGCFWYEALLSPSRERLLMLSERPRVAHVYDVRTGEELARRTLTGLPWRAGAAFTPDSHEIALTWDGRIVVLDAATLEDTGIAYNCPQAVRPAFTLDGSCFCTHDSDGYFRFRDLPTGTVLEEFETGAMVRGGDFPISPDGRFLATNFRGSRMTVVDLKLDPDRPAYEELSGHESWIGQLAISKDGSLLASAGPFDPHVHLWDLEGGSLLARLPRPTADLIADSRALLSFADGDRALVHTSAVERLPGGELRCAVHHWDLTTGVKTVPHSVIVPAGERAYDQGPGEIELARAFLAVRGRPEEARLGLDVAALNDGARFVQRDHGVSYGGVHVRSEPEQQRRVLNSMIARSITPHADGEHVLVGHDGFLNRLHPETGEYETILRYGDQSLSSMGYSPNGAELALGLADGRVLIVDTEFNVVLLEFQAHPPGAARFEVMNDSIVEGFPPGGSQHAVIDLCWTPDGTRLVTASGDATLRIWDSVRPHVRERRTERLMRIRQALRGEAGDSNALLQVLNGVSRSDEEKSAARVLLIAEWGRATRDEG